MLWCGGGCGVVVVVVWWWLWCDGCGVVVMVVDGVVDADDDVSWDGGVGCSDLAWLRDKLKQVGGT